jgi:hypothetical protein
MGAQLRFPSHPSNRGKMASGKETSARRENVTKSPAKSTWDEFEQFFRQPNPLKLRSAG